jgi:hypothetical protein
MVEPSLKSCEFIAELLADSKIVHTLILLYKDHLASIIHTKYSNQTHMLSLYLHTHVAT